VERGKRGREKLLVGASLCAAREQASHHRDRGGEARW